MSHSHQLIRYLLISMYSLPTKINHETINPYELLKSNFEKNTNNSKDKFNSFHVQELRQYMLEHASNDIVRMVYDIIVNDEFYEALHYVLENYQDCNVNDWWAQTEAEDIVRDRRLISKGMRPVHSTTLAERIIINLPCTKRHIYNNNNHKHPINQFKINHSLPQSIALVCEWLVPETTNWNSKVIAIMNTIEDFWIVINTFSQEFPRALRGFDNKATELLHSLMRPGGASRTSGLADKNNNDELINITEKNKTRINSIVSKFNSLYPIWSFIRVRSDTTLKSKVEVPFIRNKGRAENDININLKETKSNLTQGIKVLDDTFCYGYVPRLILDFVRGALAKEFTAIVFSKTIAVLGRVYKGYRLRVLVNDTDIKLLTKSKTFIEKTFTDKISNDCKIDYRKCIVKITIPTKI